MFQKISVKRTLLARIEQCDLETYLTHKGWKKTINGWTLNSGHEMTQCLDFQMMVEQLSFVENRDSFFIFEDIDVIRKNRISKAWDAAIKQHGVTAFELFCDDKGLSFADNCSVNRELSCWGSVYLKEQDE